VRRREASGSELDARLLALRDAVAAGDGVVDARSLEDARALVGRAGERLGHGLEHTVVALAGATGSGKSSIFNALVGEVISTVGARRPTTSRTSAAVWGTGAEGLLDWLAVPARHVVPTDRDDPLCGLVLLDLPDHDSTSLDHRAEVDRVVAVADMIVWVLDPQKYADAAVHDGYLRPLASHADVLLVVLNQADRVDDRSLQACVADLDRLLDDDGLSGVPVLTTSAATGAGIADVRAALGRRVAARDVAVDRLGADVTDVAERLRRACRDGSGSGVSATDRARVVEAMGEAAGVQTVTDAVARSHRAQGTRRVAWPFTRWLGRLRPDPLRRLHLERAGGSAARTSLPAPSDVSLARLETAVRDLTDNLGDDLPDAWSDAVRADALEGSDTLAARLDVAVASTDLGVGHGPRWWSAVGALQWLLAVVALAGAAWLGVLAVLGYFRLGDVGTPDLGEIPLPTAMLLGGALAGLLVAAASRPFLAVGAHRRAQRAGRRLRTSVAAVADDELIAPAEALVARHRAFCEAVHRARRADGRRR
jgi:GTP-binding protein EngB required for normal cell division